MRIVVPPAVVKDRIVRVVAPIHNLFEVEVWAGEWWEPSSVTLSTASTAPSATRELLDANGIPGDDRIPDPERLTFEQVTALLQPSTSAQRWDLLSAGDVGRSKGIKVRREYAGSAKFRRPRRGKKIPRAKRPAPH